MNEPDISVILPYFNAQNTLAEAANSMLKQGFSNLELILVNNASTDQSEKIALEIAENDSRIVCLKEMQKGVSHAFNTGLNKAKGAFIARMDADDIAHPTRLQKQMDVFKKQPEIRVVATQVTIPSKANNKGFKAYVNWSNSLISSEEIYLNRFVEQPVINPTILCRKAIFDACGSYLHGDFPEDYDWFLRVLEKYKISKIAEPLLTWRDLPNRLSRNDARYSQDAFYKTKAKYLAKWLLDNKLPNLKIAIWGYGKQARKRVKHLSAYGVEVATFIDVKPKSGKSDNYLYFKNIPTPGKYFIVSYVGNRGARDEIRHFLKAKGYQEGKDFLMAA